MSESSAIGFARHHRRAMLALLILLLACVGWRLMRNRTFIDDPQPAHPLREAELADRIDPNTADVATLAALPGLGEKRAAEIVAFRERYVREHAGSPAFSRPEDLLRIHGIGYAMMTQLSPFMLFASDQRAATTRAG